jgi:Na+/melibiose symporter-like transporter
MAADNFFAIFMLPLFGALSDKTKSKYGKRMPYMVIGMILSVVVFPLIAVAYYKDTVVGVVIMMALILVIMNMYRNPAVALMPDVTPKPLRSQANGIINLVGYIGAVLGGGIALVIGFIFKDLKSQAITAFLVASFFMLLALVILILKINENKIIEEMKEEMELGEKLAENFKSEDPKKQLSKQDKKNTFILLFALLFWFISFNAVETFYSIFCSKAFPDASFVGTIVMAGLPLSSIVTFLLTINLPVKLGRKNCILIGLIAIIISFGIIVLQGLIGYNIIIFIVAIITCGVGWALINANSYPMLVEVAN